MNIPILYNSAIGSCFVILLIAIDYTRKFNADHRQRKLLLTTLFAAFVSMVLDYICFVLSTSPATLFNNVAIKIVNSMYLISQICCFYAALVFIDYFSHGSVTRSRKFYKASSIFLIVYAVSVIVNIPFGFYFSISANNDFMPGNFYPLQILLCFIPMAITIVDVILAPKQFKQSQGRFMIAFILIIVLGVALDIIFRADEIYKRNFIWPSVTAACLYIYFFIVKSNFKIDRLSGLGNRYSCSEFIDKLSRQTEEENHTIAMLGLGRLKEINEKLGHKEGDNALRDLSTIIKGCMRQTDFAARYGGDVFLVSTSTRDNIQRLIDRIEEALEEQNKLRSRPYQLMISFGYDIFTTNAGRSIIDFVNHVEDLMYKCKDVRMKDFPSVLTADTPSK
jgi:diguanylate cyclase (GGDEF)-like protein